MTDSLSELELDRDFDDHVDWRSETARRCEPPLPDRLHGAFVETGAKPPLLTRVTVRLPLARRPALAIDGYVVRHDEGGIAVEWLEPGSDATIELMSLAVQESPHDIRVPAPAEAAAAVSSF